MRASRVDIDWRPELPIFASESFLKAVGDEYGWIGGFDDSGKLRCILPYTVIRKGIFRMVRFRVETIRLDDDLNIEEEKSFLNNVIGYFRSINADMIIPATTNAIFRTYPDGAIAAPYGTYVVDLCHSKETLWGNLNSSHRRKVRIAIKEGVQIRSGMEYMDIAYELVRDTFKRSKIRFMGFEAFRCYLLGLGGNVKILVADFHGTLQGCLVVPFSHHTAYYVYGGSNPEPQTGATNLLHWEAIQTFRELGIQHYDFVGVRINPEKESKAEGLMMYKQRFGGRLVKGFMWKYALRPLKFSAYSLAVRYFKGGDIVDHECHKLGRV